ncbi:MAG: hypothetical protein ACJAZM_001686 [Cyclobacteriaceae bacterium]|jgi:hypothetical protein
MKRKKNEVNNSGIELAIALIDAPLTPSERFLPTYSDAVMKPSPARQITRQHIVINKSGIKIPIRLDLVGICIEITQYGSKLSILALPA